MLNGGPVTWSSHRQKCVSLSKTRVCGSNLDASPAQRSRLGAVGPTLVRCDNQRAIRLIRNPELHQRTKHIDVKYHFVRSLQGDGTIDAVCVNTEAQLADILTKGLDSTRFRRLRSNIGVEELALPVWLDELEVTNFTADPKNQS